MLTRVQLRAISTEDKFGLEPISRDLPFWATVIAIVLLVGVCISKDSLWIDEGFTAWVVQHHSVFSLLAAMAQTGADDKQYPLYIAYIWAWCQLAGSSELALRLANLPFVVIYVLAISITSRLVIGSRFSWVCFALIPFLWLYASEARQYAMLLAFGTMTTGATIIYAFGPREKRSVCAWIVAGSLMLTVSSNMLGLLLVPGAVILLFAARNLRNEFRWSNWLMPAVVFSPPILFVTLFYASTLTGASYGREIREHGSRFPPIAFAAQVLYEDLGFDGLGPPRNILRVDPSGAAPAYAPWLALGGLLIFAALSISLKDAKDPRYRIVLIAFGFAFAIALAISYVTHSRFLGRHLAALLPLLVFSFMFLIRSRASLALLCTMFLISDFRLTALPGYERDDYRSAVHDIVQRSRATPGAIDWVADWYTGSYYGLALQFFPRNPEKDEYAATDFQYIAKAVSTGGEVQPSQVHALLSRQLEKGQPVYLALSKPDLYDTNNAWRDAIETFHARRVAEYRSFVIYVLVKPSQKSLCSDVAQ